MSKRVFRFATMGGVVMGVAALIAPKMVQGEDISWVEDFTNDPIVAERFEVHMGHDAGKFEYDGGAPSLTVHYHSSEPTAWYVRPIDANLPRTLGRCEDFEFAVTFRIRSNGFVADPDSFAQIGWGLINTQTTGIDRSGGSLNGPYAFDTATFDYFPNVSPLFGGPTLGTSVTHGDDGNGFFSSIDFPFGAESETSVLAGDDVIALDTVYTGRVRFDSAAQTATLLVEDAPNHLAINTDGNGGPGGPDNDVTTIQTTLFVESPFALDAFALTAWEDTFDFDPESPSVVADVDIMEITFFARTLIKGDMNRDGRVDGLDIGPFVEALLAADPMPCAVQRADFTSDDSATVDDIPDFEAALLAP